MPDLEVDLVAPDHKMWSGRASMVTARTPEGELGVLPGHEPLLATLADGMISISPWEGPPIRAAVHGGFLSVDGDRVSILAEVAELAEDIDLARAEAALARHSARPDDLDAVMARKRAELRIAVAQSSHHR